MQNGKCKMRNICKIRETFACARRRSSRAGRVWRLEPFQFKAVAVLLCTEDSSCLLVPLPRDVTVQPIRQARRQQPCRNKIEIKKRRASKDGRTTTSEPTNKVYNNFSFFSRRPALLRRFPSIAYA